MLVIVWSNGIQTLLVQRFGAWHMVTTIQLAIVALLIRVRLPQTIVGCMFSLAALLYVGIVGETYVSIYAWAYYIRTDYPVFVKIISAGWIGMVCFWAIVIGLQAYQLFNTRTIFLGLVPITIFTLYWFFALNFVGSLVMTVHSSILTAAPLPNLLEQVYYTGIFSTFILAFKAW